MIRWFSPAISQEPKLLEIPVVIQPLLTEYTKQLHKILPGLVGGVYLHGSMALGAFDPAHSDLDFVAMLNRPPTSEDCDQLRAIHAMIAEHYPKWPMEGSYLQASDFRKYGDEGVTALHIHDGHFSSTGSFDLNTVT